MNSIDSLELVVNEVNEGKLKRRKLRNIIFRLRSNRLFDKFEQDRALGVKMIYEPQFRKVPIINTNGRIVAEEIMSWENFTFLWDLDPQFPLKIVLTSEWVHAGGEYTKEGLCKPTAFTRQKA